MQLEAEAERLKRRDIILSEANKIAEVNMADGHKQSQILRAQGEAEAINLKAQKEREGLKYLSQQISGSNTGRTALSYILTHRYYDEYQKILEKSNVTVLPDSGKGEQSGSNSDILGVVAMMQNGGFKKTSSGAKSLTEDVISAKNTTSTTPKSMLYN